MIFLPLKLNVDGMLNSDSFLFNFKDGLTMCWPGVNQKLFNYL